jgi:phosphate transport system protein
MPASSSAPSQSSERSLAEEYEVAYTTVRHAMAVLRERGIIVTVHGRIGAKEARRARQQSERERSKDSLATLARWCRIRSYLDSAAARCITALDAIGDAIAGNPGDHHSPPVADPDSRPREWTPLKIQVNGRRILRSPHANRECAADDERIGGLVGQLAAEYAFSVGENRQEFERDLEAIEAKVIELFAMVAEDLPRATEALLTGNNEVLQVLLEREQVIDALYPEIEELVNREILLQAPVASDLRFLISVLRIVPELERSHDLVVQVASRANHILGEDLSPRTRGIVERMGRLASDMWRQAVDSWYQRDRSAASALETRDDEMDELHASLIAELASGRMALPVTMEMTLVARFYERLGDHAVNIARRVVYLAGTAKK